MQGLVFEVICLCHRVHTFRDFFLRLSLLSHRKVVSPPLPLNVGVFAPLAAMISLFFWFPRNRYSPSPAAMCLVRCTRTSLSRTTRSCVLLTSTAPSSRCVQAMNRSEEPSRHPYMMSGGTPVCIDLYDVYFVFCTLCGGGGGSCCHVYLYGYVESYHSHARFFFFFSLTVACFLLLVACCLGQVYGAGGDRSDSYKVSDTVLEVQNETSGKIHELKLSHFWPVRKPRPVLEKLPGNSALTTGLRVIDTIFP